MAALTDNFQLHHAKLQIRKLFQDASPDCRLIRVGRNGHVYTAGERDSMVYCVESGRVKELLISAEGRECLLMIHSAGDIFGESCLCGQMARIETVTAMQETMLKRMPSRILLNLLKRNSLTDSLVQYLAGRIIEQQEVTATLLTANSEERLAKMLLRMASKHGRIDGRGKCIQRIRHEELAEMVGTTRSRIGFFLKRFRGLGLVELGRDRSLIVRETKLEEYVESYEFNYGRGIDGLPPLAPGMRPLLSEDFSIPA